jgi:hypothetical protein
MRTSLDYGFNDDLVSPNTCRQQVRGVLRLAGDFVHAI